MGLCTDGEVSSEKGEDAQDRKAQQVTHGGVSFYYPTALRRVMLVTGRGSFAASGLFPGTRPLGIFPFAVLFAP